MADILNGSDTLQPFYNSELNIIQNKDAVAEIGIEKSNKRQTSIFKSKYFGKTSIL
jgi:hypothetical protein